MEHQAWLHKSQRLPFLLPDTKSQVALRYQDSRVHSVGTAVVSTQHNPDVSLDALRGAVVGEIVRPVISPHWLTPQTRFLANPAGNFVIGEPVGDYGLTGRKVIVDTYGGAACHGGGALSGKDPSKVDRSAAYATRCMAKNIVAARLASRCEVRLGWVIDLPRSVSVRVNTFGIQTASSEALLRGVNSHSDLSVFGIATTLDLLVPRHCKAACCGHFGHNSFPWEVTDKAALLYEDVGR